MIPVVESFTLWWNETRLVCRSSSVASAKSLSPIGELNHIEEGLILEATSHFKEALFQEKGGSPVGAKLETIFWSAFRFSAFTTAISNRAMSQYQIIASTPHATSSGRLNRIITVWLRKTTELHNARGT
jgi:hypothetical protein